MSKWQVTNFKPRWAHEPDSAFADMPDVGYPTEAPPRLVTRIVSTDGGNSISSPTLSDAISITQHIFDFVAHEVVYGVDRSLADLRTIDSRVQQLAKLHIEPFEVGSFIIPAEFTTEPVEFAQDGTERVVFAKQVLERFNSIMEGISGNNFDYETSIGTIRCIESLNRILKRDASFLEYQSTGFSESMILKSKKFTINDQFIKKITEIRKYRQEAVVKHGSLEGVVVALDFDQMKLKLRLTDGQMVKGDFLPIMSQVLESVLCKHVRLHGSIQYRKSLPVSIDAVAVEALPNDKQEKPAEDT